ncbi:putative adhesin [Escherichia coli]|nr:putative adhesin [Escherichia coli]CTR78996.1 putative adhesin [Escherichia coli]CTV02121.1 putative adhesin [Escherichia coli]
MKKNKYSTPLWVLATILAGMLSPMQSAVNGQLGHWLQDGNACAVISFASGLVVMFFIIMARKEIRQQFAAIPSLIKNRKVPLWNWFAGLCGAMVVFSEGASASALGVATFQTALISALLLSGLLCDRFGIGAGGSLSGRTQLSKGASMVLNGDVVSTGDIVNAGEIRFDNQTTPDAALSRAVAKGDSPVTFHKLTTSNLTGQGGTINMRVRLDGSNTSDQLVINGGQATGKTWLAFTNVGNSNLGVATSGQGIRVVDAQNGATTEEGAFALSRPLQAGAFNYTLNRDSDEDWYLRSENAYRAEVPLYTSMLTQAMDYDRILAGSRSHQTGVNGENNSVRLSIQGGHLGHDNNGGIARGATPESSGSYGFVRLEGDLLRTEVAGMSLTTGVHGAAGHSSVDVKDDDGSRAGTVRDDAGSLGGYLNLTHTSSGLWADIVAQGTRHSMKASSDNNDFRARGWGWLGSLETGLPFSITDNLMLEPQLQYTWQGLSLDDGQDNAGYVKFGHGSAQHVRAGFRLGSHNDMSFGEGTSSRDTLRDSAKHRVRELPVNWWVQPSVIRTFSSRGDMSMGTAAAGSNMTFSPSRNGTSLDLQAGLEARVRENITLGVQAGYAHSVSGSSAEGYNGQATLNVTF